MRFIRFNTDIPFFVLLTFAFLACLVYAHFECGYVANSIDFWKSLGAICSCVVSRRLFYPAIYAYQAAFPSHAMDEKELKQLRKKSLISNILAAVYSMLLALELFCYLTWSMLI